MAHSCGCSINQNDKRKEFLRKLSSGTNQRMKEWNNEIMKEWPLSGLNVLEKKKI